MVKASEFIQTIFKVLALYSGTTPSTKILAWSMCLNIMVNPMIIGKVY